MPAGQRRPDRWCMFGRGGHAQPPQAGRRVRAARQPLLQRPRLGRRPSLVDDGLQHRLHRPELGPDLLAARRASTTTTRATCRTPPRGYLWDACAAAGLTLPQLRRVRPAASASPTARSRSKGACRAWSATCAPTTASPRPGSESATPTTSRRSSRSSASSRRTATLPAVHRHEPGRRPHHGHHARHVHPAGLRRQQRPGPGPARRGGQPEQVLEETAIFVIEDDAQNGPDHVDAHRTVGLVDQPLHQAASTSTARSTAPSACSGRWS